MLHRSIPSRNQSVVACLGLVPALVAVVVTEFAGYPLPRVTTAAAALAGVLVVGAIAAVRQRDRRKWIAGGVSLLVVAAGVAALLWMVPLRTRDLAVALPQLLHAAEQFFGEHPERIFVRYDDLVGPERFLKNLDNRHADYRPEFPLRVDLREIGVTMPRGHRVILLCDPKGNYQAFVRRLPDGRIFNLGSGRLAQYGVTHYRQWTADRPRNGVDVRVLRDGRRLEITNRDGIPHGPLRAFHVDGRLWGEATYANGRPVGRHVVYDRDGTVLHTTVF